MFDFGLTSVHPHKYNATRMALGFRCGCVVQIGQCEYEHEDGPCGLWAPAPDDLNWICVSHYLILNDHRSLN